MTEKSPTKLTVLNSLRDRREMMHLAIASACLTACADSIMGEDGSVETDGEMVGDASVRDTGVREFDVPNQPFDVPNQSVDVPNQSVDVPNGRDVPNASMDSGACNLPAGFIQAGRVASIPVGMFVFNGANSFFVGHDAMGFYALSSSCTHRGCDVAVRGAGFQCPCHQATYDANGVVTGGPAPSPLPHYALRICGGIVYVNPRMVVAANVRTQP